MNNRQAHLPAIQIRSERLARHCRIAPDPKHIILNLECKAKILAKIEERLRHRAIGTSDNRTKPRSCRNQRRRFTADHRQVIRLSDTQVPFIAQIKELALTKRTTRRFETAKDFQGPLGGMTKVNVPMERQVRNY